MKLVLQTDVSYTVTMNKFSNFLNSTLGRLVIIVVIGAVAAVVALAVTHNGSKKYDGARQAADIFAKAVETCDGNKAKKYVKSFSDPVTFAHFEQTCVKGRNQLTFSHQVNALTTQQKGMEVRNVYFDYTLKAKGQPDVHIFVTTAWTSKNPHWLVISANQAQPHANGQKQQ